jgi:hypothetical protein
MHLEIMPSSEFTAALISLEWPLHRVSCPDVNGQRSLRPESSIAEGAFVEKFLFEMRFFMVQDAFFVGKAFWTK